MSWSIETSSSGGERIDASGRFGVSRSPGVRSLLVLALLLADGVESSKADGREATVAVTPVAERQAEESSGGSILPDVGGLRG